MFNILCLFNWTTWFLIVIIIILVFWIVYGGRHEYEFVGVKPLSTKSLFENISNLPYQPSKDLIFSQKVNQPNVIVEKKQNKSCKGEDLVAEILENILNSKIKRNIRPSFLKNPETGKNLELDCYNEEYAIAAEYNGIQHYKFPSAFHKTEKDFYDQLYRDRLKKKLCDEAGVYLISIPYWVDNYGTEDGHLGEKIVGKKNFFPSREIKYQRIYEYLYTRVEEYFKKIYPEQYPNESNEDFFEEEYEEEDLTEDEEDYTEEDEEEDYSEQESINGFIMSNGNEEDEEIIGY